VSKFSVSLHTCFYVFFLTSFMQTLPRGALRLPAVPNSEGENILMLILLVGNIILSAYSRQLSCILLLDMAAPFLMSTLLSI
jgi:hypothetical protein